jgi:hypothetical protein
MYHNPPMISEDAPDNESMKALLRSFNSRANKGEMKLQYQESPILASKDM